MQEGLRRRVRQLEQRSGVDSKYVLMPLPGHPGQFFRLPRPFAEFMMKAAQNRDADGRNLTDEISNGDTIQQK